MRPSISSYAHSAISRRQSQATITRLDSNTQLAELGGEADDDITHPIEPRSRVAMVPPISVSEDYAVVGKCTADTTLVQGGGPASTVVDVV